MNCPSAPVWERGPFSAEPARAWVPVLGPTRRVLTQAQRAVKPAPLVVAQAGQVVKSAQPVALPGRPAAHSALFAPY